MYAFYDDLWLKHLKNTYKVISTNRDPCEES